MGTVCDIFAGEGGRTLRRKERKFRRCGGTFLHTIPSPPATQKGVRPRPQKRHYIKRRHPHRHLAQQRGRLGKPAPLQPRLPGWRTARRLLRRRSELGLPHLQLGRNGKGRIRLVEGSPDQNERIFRRLQARPHPWILPHLVDTEVADTRIDGRIRPRNSNPQGRIPKPWTPIRRKQILQTLHSRTHRPRIVPGFGGIRQAHILGRNSGCGGRIPV